MTQEQIQETLAILPFLTAQNNAMQIRLNVLLNDLGIEHAPRIGVAVVKDKKS